ncbi:hypothetical protein AB0M83_17720 [Amycolatopsis sp. NPDC051106]|uniref:hypothetical protein n=1 Tax=unclassified Amycolatopsis TaxID=2618356 RepID=UPI003435AA98
MSSSDGVTRFVTTMMGIVIGLTFLFGFGNVLALALRIGVPVYVEPLVAPAVDLTDRQRDLHQTRGASSQQI